ncbi:hypothetical protein [Mesorhizobium sp. NFR06]|uniref:hypothetical protein n=1 Tax=Mesorhizobium sp. NFR06 TaxID=1566290 RepID=UPI00122D9AD7|nr:hypothetical protein [Mesorhizobium sp. NFR06]
MSVIGRPWKRRLDRRAEQIVGDRWPRYSCFSGAAEIAASAGAVAMTARFMEASHAWACRRFKAPPALTASEMPAAPPVARARASGAAEIAASAGAVAMTARFMEASHAWACRRFTAAPALTASEMPAAPPVARARASGAADGKSALAQKAVKWDNRRRPALVPAIRML